MRVRDVIKPWPPNSGWTVSYGDAEILEHDSARAVVHSSRADKEGVFLTVTEGGRQFSTMLVLDEQALSRRVATALSAARGKTLDEAGDQALEE